MAIGASGSKLRREQERLQFFQENELLLIKEQELWSNFNEAMEADSRILVTFWRAQEDLEDFLKKFPKSKPTDPARVAVYSLHDKAEENSRRALKRLNLATVALRKFQTIHGLHHFC